MFRPHSQDLGGGSLPREDSLHGCHIVGIGGSDARGERQRVLHNSTRDCTGQLPQDRGKQSHGTVGIETEGGYRRACGLARQQRFVGTGVVRHAGQGRPHGRIEVLRQRWQHLETQAVSRIGQIEIGAVLAPRSMPTPELLTKLVARALEQRSNQVLARG
jgi:hypothetical protein